MGHPRTVVREYLWGTQYLDELVCLWMQKGYHMFVAHDANYNAIGLTDKAGNEVEKYAYTPYGQVLVDQTCGRGDIDGDGHGGHETSKSLRGLTFSSFLRHMALNCAAAARRQD